MFDDMLVSLEPKKTVEFEASLVFHKMYALIGYAVPLVMLIKSGGVRSMFRVLLVEKSVLATVSLHHADQVQLPSWMPETWTDQVVAFIGVALVWLTAQFPVQSDHNCRYSMPRLSEQLSSKVTDCEVVLKLLIGFVPN